MLYTEQKYVIGDNVVKHHNTKPETNPSIKLQKIPLTTNMKIILDFHCVSKNIMFHDVVTALTYNRKLN